MLISSSFFFFYKAYWYRLVITLEGSSKQQMTGEADEGRCDDFMVEHRLQNTLNKPVKTD